MNTRILIPIGLIALAAFTRPITRLQTAPSQPAPLQPTSLQPPASQPTQTDPWTPAQLLEPADLAAQMAHPSGTAPLLICVGPSGVIKGSIETGPARDKQNLDKLKALLEKENRDREVIIYCGCCPFVHCPNIRPAFTLLTEMHFTHPRLLNLSHNIKVDWMDKGYPVVN